MYVDKGLPRFVLVGQIESLSVCTALMQPSSNPESLAFRPMSSNTASTNCKVSSSVASSVSTRRAVCRNKQLRRASSSLADLLSVTTRRFLARSTDVCWSSPASTGVEPANPEWWSGASSEHKPELRSETVHGTTHINSMAGSRCRRNQPQSVLA